LAERIAKVRRAIVVVRAKVEFLADAVDGADEIAVADGVRGLFDLPQSRAGPHTYTCPGGPAVAAADADGPVADVAMNRSIMAEM
jgi:hypothetical protein